MSADGLFWIRRRNERWWPGQVLEVEELPDSLPSPKVMDLHRKDNDQVRPRSLSFLCRSITFGEGKLSRNSSTSRT